MNELVFSLFISGYSVERCIISVKTYTFTNSVKSGTVIKLFVYM